MPTVLYFMNGTFLILIFNITIGFNKNHHQIILIFYSTVILLPDKTSNKYDTLGIAFFFLYTIQSV